MAQLRDPYTAPIFAQKKKKWRTGARFVMMKFDNRAVLEQAQLACVRGLYYAERNARQALGLLVREMAALDSAEVCPSNTRTEMHARALARAHTHVQIWF